MRRASEAGALAHARRWRGVVGMVGPPGSVVVACDPTSRGVAVPTPIRARARRRLRPPRGGRGGGVDLGAADRAAPTRPPWPSRSGATPSSLPVLGAVAGRSPRRAGGVAGAVGSGPPALAAVGRVPRRPLRHVDPEPLVHHGRVVGGARRHPAGVGGAHRPPARRAHPPADLDGHRPGAGRHRSCSPASTCRSPAGAVRRPARAGRRDAGGRLRHRRAARCASACRPCPTRWPATPRRPSLLLGALPGRARRRSAATTRTPGWRSPAWSSAPSSSATRW